MDKVKVYFDENMPTQLARGLNLLQHHLNYKESLQIEVLAIKDVFGRGATDEQWIPEIGKENAVVITQDYRIQTLRHQKQLYVSSGAGLLFIKSPSKGGFSYWEMVKLIVNKWDEIKGIIGKYTPPYAFRYMARSGFQRIDS